MNENVQNAQHLQCCVPAYRALLGGLCRLLGLMKRLTAVLMFALGAAYLWPYAAEHLFKK